MTLGASLTLSGPQWYHLHEEVRVFHLPKAGAGLSPRPTLLKDLAAAGRGTCSSLPVPTCPQHWGGQGPSGSRLGGQEIGKARKWKSWEPPQTWSCVSANQGLNHLLLRAWKAL